MKEIQNLYLSSLPDCQRKIWPELTTVSSLGFVLYGGTSLALRFGHRVSVDFDFFSSQKITKDSLFSILPFLKNYRIIQDDPGRFAFSFVADYGAQLTFLGGFRNGRIDDPVEDRETHIQLASIKDIFAYKLGAIHGRASSKDYQDIAEILRHGYSLEEAMAGASKLIKGMPAPVFTLKALCYFNDVNISENDRNAILKACGNLRKIPEVEIIADSLRIENDEVAKHDCLGDDAEEEEDNSSLSPNQQ